MSGKVPLSSEGSTTAALKRADVPCGEADDTCTDPAVVATQAPRPLIILVQRILSHKLQACG